VARAAAGVLPASDVLRDLLAELCAGAHSERPDAAALVEVTLRAREVPLDEALRALDNLIGLEPGAYVLDPQRGAVGRVRGFDADRGGMAVEFEDGEKSYPPAMAGRLAAVEQDDFRALSGFERERLSALAQDAPEELCRILLTTLDRRMALRRVRLYLEPVVGSWSRWWSGARKALARSAVIGMTAGKSPSLFLRARPLTHGERLRRQFDAAGADVARLSEALRICREARHGHGIDGAVVQHAADGVAPLLGAEADETPVALAALAVLRQLEAQGAAMPEVHPSALDGLSSLLTRPEALARALPRTDVLLACLDMLRQERPGAWVDFFVALMALVKVDVGRGVLS
jgi:hypothetical protein